VTKLKTKLREAKIIAQQAANEENSSEELLVALGQIVESLTLSDDDE